MTDYVTSQLNADPVDPMLVAQLRTVALMDTGATILSDDSGLQLESASSASADVDTGNVIDVEIVAIYW